MKIGNLEIKLFYSNLAVREINELCGGVAKISNLFEDENGNHVPYEVEISNIIKLILILANANITKENCEKRLGIADGEEKPKFTYEELEQMIDIGRLGEYTQEIMSAMGLASKFEVPDGLKITEQDIDLDEIEAEKNP